MKIENLWKAITNLSSLFEVQKIKINEEEYEVKYNVLDQNGEIIKF